MVEMADERELVRAAMSALGKRSTRKKRQAARSNGSLGGRPKGSTYSAPRKRYDQDQHGEISYHPVEE